MKLKINNILISTILVFSFIITITSVTINLLYKNIKLSNEEYINLILSDSFNDNIYSKLVNIFTKINPVYIIELPSYNSPYVSNIYNDNSIVYIYNTSNKTYKNEFNYKPDCSLTAYLLSTKLNNIGVNSIYDNLYSFSKNNNINITNTMKINKYNTLYNIDIGINDTYYFKKILITISTNVDNIIFVNELTDNLNSNKNIISKVYLTDDKDIKINIGSTRNSITEVLEYIDILSLSIKEVINES